MAVPKKFDVLLVCQNSKVTTWLDASLQLTKLPINIIEAVSLSELFTLVGDVSHQQIVILDQAACSPLLEKQVIFNKAIDAPALVLSDSFNTKFAEKIPFSTVDAIPLPALTLNLLEHTIRSVLKDYIYTNKLTKLAHYDPLTGAANRLLFNDRLGESIKRAKRYNEPLSLVYFDLDEFKPVNDTYGHHVGDILLKKFVQIIKQQVRESDTVARMGGDEFVLILPNTHFSGLNDTTEKIQSALKLPQKINGISIEIKTSIGGVCVDRHHQEALDKAILLRYADECVYKAKKLTAPRVVIKMLESE
ncbi:hypothetical protein C2869_00825 [Saccharobesus litoralis]|uniref:GGDEF domain-containing protein n=1 Tax=Saccharobesus litoralis TaxID=2172099 RepID=A0A2S0VLJ1_9ALTE|nr:GGDEF domain-containing protein [Saccharobesus litoralis]AWB65072.1 hypothetical protein C2869_00825 [Saccharobesus litoralis]